jgi:ribonuclease E
VVFVAPAEPAQPTRGAEVAGEAAAGDTPAAGEAAETAAEDAAGRRRRRRGRRGRGGHAGDAETADEETADGAESAEPPAEEAAGAADASGTDGEVSAAGTRRRRRRRRADATDGGSEDDPPSTVVHVREVQPRSAGSDGDGVKAVRGSTRLEAKRQRRRDGRDSGRRRPSILTEAEFLARRESVDRVMAVREKDGRTQVAVLEDGVLVEHYVTRASSTSYVGNIYLGRVQNVLPSMEAAFVDIGKGRNGVLYAGEVNWDAAGLEGKARAIEDALKPGDTPLVQVTKDPVGHKGARLTSQISLPGRFLVYVPGGGMTGISRKLPDNERNRLKAILKKVVPEDAGVIIRTAAEGASEQDLAQDVERLRAQWEAISRKGSQSKSAPMLVHGEPDLAIRVVRDVFNEDFRQLVVQGDEVWSTVSGYVRDVAPDLAERVTRHTGETDLFGELRVDEQLAKALDRKVWLPSGGSLVIDRTEAMTVVDVNTGRFVGSGGNLEQTVTRNNLEAAEEIVRQLRLRDIGGIVVIDFIDMVLESNRELVLRRLMECLGRDRTKHQVAEVTSLGLVQMTRKRVGEGLLEAFSETCPTCNGRGVIVHTEPVDKSGDAEATGSEDGRQRRRGRRRAAGGPDGAGEQANDQQRRAANTAMAAIHRAGSGDDELAQVEPADAFLDDEDDDEDEVLSATDARDEDMAADPIDLAEAGSDGTDTDTDAPDRGDGYGSDRGDADAYGPDADAPDLADADTGSADRNEQPEAPEAAPPLVIPTARRRRAARRPAGPPLAVGSESG